MTNNENIMEILDGITTPAGEAIPVSFLVYKGDKETYITFQQVDKYPRLMADDECEYSAPRYDFDIYTKGNFLSILEEVKNRLKNADWTWVEDSADMYEPDTQYFHKVTTFEIENYKL